MMKSECILESWCWSFKKKNERKDIEKEICA